MTTVEASFHSGSEVSLAL